MVGCVLKRQPSGREPKSWARKRGRRVARHSSCAAAWTNRGAQIGLEGYLMDTAINDKMAMKAAIAM